MKKKTKIEKDIKACRDKINEEITKKEKVLKELDALLPHINPEKIDKVRAMSCIAHEIAILGVFKILKEFMSIKLKQLENQGGDKNEKRK